MTAYYNRPSSRILSDPAFSPSNAAIYKADDLAGALSSFGLKCAPAGVDAAPQLLTYHFNLENPLQRSALKRPLMALSAILHCPITETPSKKAHFAITFPRPERVGVPFLQCLLNKRYNDNKSPFSACIGYDTANNPIIIDITKAPHLLIAGATGAGKSVCLNTLLNALLFRATPNKMRLLMIDTKRVELSAYEGLPHLYAPIAKDGKTAAEVIRNLQAVMRERQAQMEKMGVNDVKDTNFPRILLVIDELADLILMRKEEVEPPLISIAQLGRAAGIHLILATQRPTVNVVTGLLKANIPCRIALQTASIRDSMTILDHKGAERLTGRGDAILKTPDKVEETRMQIAYIDRTDINAVTNWWRTCGVTTE